MRRFLILCALSFCLLLGACAREPLYQSQTYVFGTLVDISIYGEPEARARELANHIQQEFQRLHNQYHAWQQGSEVTRLNQAFAKGETVAISPELAAILKDVTTWSEKSGGLFNPAIGQLVNVWGFQAEEFKPVRPGPAKIAALVKADPQMHDIVIEGTQASSRNPAVKLDLGGYVKGYALDLAAGYLRQQGVANALINIGGNIIAVGSHGAKPWRVGIQHPREPGPIATLDLPDGWAIGTSGDYQRFFELDGTRYCHIIDPRTGYPAQGTQAVTVLVPPGKQAGTISDVASKPIFIVAPDERQAAARKMGVENVMIIDKSGHIAVSKAMAKRIIWVDKNAAPQIF